MRPDNEKTAADPVVIPLAKLSSEVLRAVVEQFVLREGTDYGVSPVSFETKIEQVLTQLERGDALVVFDPTTESVTLLKAEECPPANHQES